MDLIIASGYPYPYKNQAAELAASKAGNWFPVTVDFWATAATSGGAQGAATFDQLLKVIGKKNKGSISELGIVGHASPDSFVLGGHINQGMIRSTKDAVIRVESIRENLDKIKAVRDRFATQNIRHPSITLYACDAGAGDELLEELSKAFQVTVRGFKQQIWWCFIAGKGGGTRGRTWYDAIGAGIHPRCESSSFSPDIRVWQPENQSFAGNQIDI